jgi:hypothetical protein
MWKDGTKKSHFMLSFGQACCTSGILKNLQQKMITDFTLKASDETSFEYRFRTVRANVGEINNSIS